MALLLEHKNTKLIIELVTHKVLLEYGEDLEKKKFFMISDAIKCMLDDSERIFGPKQETIPGQYQ